MRSPWASTMGQDFTAVDRKGGLVKRTDIHHHQPYHSHQNDECKRGYCPWANPGGQGFTAVDLLTGTEARVSCRPFASGPPEANGRQGVSSPGQRRLCEKGSGLR